ncbi:MAG: hypothetical protein ACQSGP_07120, partial [Frankia sp.]
MDALLEQSEEFAALWSAHEIGVRREWDGQRIQHPDLGILKVHGQVLFDANQAQAGSYPTRDLPAQHRVLMPKHQDY